MLLSQWGGGEGFGIRGSPVSGNTVGTAVPLAIWGGKRVPNRLLFAQRTHSARRAPHRVGAWGWNGACTKEPPPPPR